MRAATGEPSLPRQFPIVHILFGNLNSASTVMPGPLNQAGLPKAYTHDRRFRDGLEKGVREYQDSNESLATRTAELQRELDGDTR